jgi:hypothetical protein
MNRPAGLAWRGPRRSAVARAFTQPLEPASRKFPPLFDELVALDYQLKLSEIPRKFVPQSVLMLADRAPSPIVALQPASGRVRCSGVAFRSVLLAVCLLASLLAGKCTFVLADDAGGLASQARPAPVVARTFELATLGDADSAASSHFQAETTEAPTELQTNAPLQVESDWTAVIYWKPATLPSPRLIPLGLVLSYLCDSARHQCCGVRLI